MSKNHKLAILVAVFLLLALPYFGFVAYLAVTYHRFWPYWATTTLAIWFASIIAIPSILGRLMFRGNAVNTEKTRQSLKRTIAVGTKLVIIWSALFVYGAIRVLQGKYAFKNAIVAGIFLGFFIVLFGENVYGARRLLRKFQAMDGEQSNLNF